MAKTHSIVWLGDLLPGVLKDLKADSRPSLEAVEEVWKRLVGVKAFQFSRPRRLVRGRLLVGVENSGWMYTLNLKKGLLLEGLVELFGAHRVKQLTFCIGEGKGSESKDA